MKENYINVAFVIDESGSMGGMEFDVIGGFKKIIDEQKAITEGSCTVSLFKFSSKVEEIYLGRDVKDVEYLNEKSYTPGGMTAMNDGIGTTIDRVGEWLSKMKEEDRPEKTLVVIMTDGEENDSREYTFDKIKEMIKHQEEKYSWSFTYLGTDITDASVADRIGVATRGFSSRSNYSTNYDIVNSALSCYRCTSGDASIKAMAFTTTLENSCDSITEAYEKEIGKKIENNS